MRKRKIFILVLSFILVGSCLSGCKNSSEKMEYKLTVTGETQESGVISYLGYEMNVYKNLAGNPCGDCADQPVSVYVGTEAKDVVDAIVQAVERADDIWKVKEQTDSEIILIEKEAGTADKPESPSAPEGLDITGEEL